MARTKRKRNALEDGENLQTHLYVAKVGPANSEILCSFLDNALKTLELLEDNSPSSRSITVRYDRIKIWGRIYFLNSKDATAALRLHKIPFMGKLLIIKRPTRWSEPVSFRQSDLNWSHKLDPFIKAVVENATDNDNVCEKSIVVKGLISKLVLPMYLSSIMKQIGLVKQDEEPIGEIEKKGKKLWLLHFRNSRDARNALMLQNVPYGDQVLTFGRHTEWKGDATLDCIKNWNESFYEFYNKERDEKAGIKGLAEKS